MTDALVVNQLGVMDCPVAQLADEDLAAIFKHLPPYERLIVSEVSRKWRDISQTPWRDVVHLDLSQVPTAHIHAVIKKCPNLTSVSTLRQNLGDLGRFVSRLSNIISLKCVDCALTGDQSVTSATDVLASFRGASWEELICHNSKSVLAAADMPPREHPMTYGNPPTLRRLQMSAVNYQADDMCAIICSAISGLPLLESCILTYTEPTAAAGEWFSVLFSAAIDFTRATLANLRELYLQSPRHWFIDTVAALPNLKILYLINIDFARTTSLERLMTQHASLGVLVLTASHTSDFDGEIPIPVRKLFPNGFNAPPVPQLHLFLGKTAASKLRFHPSPTDALKIYPIDAPLPEFLEKEEIKPIFEGSWIASRIKEGERDGANLADYSFEGNAESILYVQE